MGTTLKINFGPHGSVEVSTDNITDAKSTLKELADQYFPKRR
jgi:hypothetical protein